jgi:U3 small nucleolar RNA-associated protein 4
MGTILAAACEDGSVRLFDTSDDSMRYMRALPTQPQRACSVAFHAEGLELVAGYGDGCIRRWHTRTGQAAYRLTVEAQDNRMVGSTPVVWAILVLQDWTIVYVALLCCCCPSSSFAPRAFAPICFLGIDLFVWRCRSGDSLGKTRFWDGRHGTLLHSFDQHTADVLCLAKNKMENKVWSAGIDAKVSLFQLVQEADAEGRRWLHTHSQRAHTHDMYDTTLNLIVISSRLTTLVQPSVGVRGPDAGEWRSRHAPASVQYRRL